MFYLLASLLVGLGCVLVFAALARRVRTGVEAEPSQTVAAVYQDRLSELRSEVKGGLAETADQDELEAELGAALLADYDELGGSAESPRPRAGARGPMGLAMVSAGVLLATVLMVYGVVGDPQAMRVAGAEQVLRLDPASDGPALQDWRDRLAGRVDADPVDSKSWYLLGHADLKLGRFASAAEAFAMAHEVHGDDPSIDLYWLQARYMAGRGEIDATTRAIAERVLSSNPNQPLVLEMFAIDAFRQGAFQESVGLLNRALAGNLESSHRRALEAGYAEARKQLGDLPASVDVAIDAQGSVPSGATLFVIARPVGGGMPFAVVRRPVSAFPRTVRLDDAVSMNPAAPLSGAGEVEVVVRLSRAGTAMAHPGDWEWRSAPLALGEDPVSLSATLAPPS